MNSLNLNLSFAQEFKVALPSFTTGSERFRAINKMLEINETWKNEAREKLRLLLAYMRKIEASDMDIGGPGSNGYIWFRVYGVKSPAPELGTFSDDEMAIVIMSAMNGEQKILLFKNKNFDYSLELALVEGEEKSRFRSDVYYARNRLVANYRRINQKLFSMQNLNFPAPIIERFNLSYEKSGLYLITGITGSGKSSTLDSIVDMNNHTNRAHIIILGKPIEYIHVSDQCLIRHREMGEDVLNFADGVYQCLRQDPDIIVVGEMRNATTIASVMEVTDTGHKVFTTLHTSSAIESLHRIIAEFPPIEQTRIRQRLAEILRVIISQKLVPNRHGTFTMIKEILSVTDSIKAAIKNGNIHEIYQMITEGKSQGMYTMEQDLVKNVKLGKISIETALNYANNKKRLKQLMSF